MRLLNYSVMPGFQSHNEHSQQNHKKNYVIKCFLKQILGIKDVIEVMPLSKIDTVFFHSNQQLKYSSSV